MFKRLLISRQKEGLPIVGGAALVAIILLLLCGMVGIMLVKGMQHFWPTPLYEVSYKDELGEQQQIYATLLSRDFTTTGGQKRWLFNQARLYQFSDQQHLLEEEQILSMRPLPELIDIQLRSGNRLFARLVGLNDGKTPLPLAQLPTQLEMVSGEVAAISDLERGRLAAIHQQIAQYNRRDVEDEAPARVKLEQEFATLMAALEARRQTLSQLRLLLVFDSGEHHQLPLADVEKYLQINQQGELQKFATFMSHIWEFVSDTPKRANSAGGVFPALFGTVVMVLLMTVIVTPLGVMAAIYLNEYAPSNSVTSLIRIGVNNLAGVPSIVYGVFGLGFFVYQVGGNIDKLFFSEHLPAPTFGAPGIFWAALTMAMLTLPVVIVATEEGLRRVPNSLRQGSYALGATQFETLWRTVIPIASPGIMTGVILAIARGAGEVAPLLLVGAVKFAPTLPVDMEFPYLHLDRQFMHLGVLIYDGAFHSNSIGHGSSMMFASCLLLLLVVLSLNIIAVVVRAKLRRQYQSMAGQG
ncbi:phosphate ABC transporter permease PstA [Bowmanella pacifica]|uniref:Phosphate transport system permease protein PstA n=1 Tax=Bowmanella pacifica TaxID=502051 RepID=A0A917YV88_9ALTE|nr:phosphate ABC transporter permease PstA [Bowmanella pacifica]GGO67199.1 phosphate transport system permease protein PstA [Bowmanella pacifica]